LVQLVQQVRVEQEEQLLRVLERQALLLEVVEIVLLAL
jgi:hypothetical protein